MPGVQLRLHFQYWNLVFLNYPKFLTVMRTSMLTFSKVFAKFFLLVLRESVSKDH